MIGQANVQTDRQREQLYIYICHVKEKKINIIAHCQAFFVKDYGTVLRGREPQMWSCWFYLCIMFCSIFVWESYLRCLPFQILYNELEFHWLYKLPIEPLGKHLYHLFIFCSLLIFSLIWNNYSMLTLIYACTRFSICARPVSAGTRSYVLSVADKIRSISVENRGVADIPRSGES